MSDLEARITSIIMRKAVEELTSMLSTDVVIVGAGPSGMTAAKYLAEKGLRVLILERRLCFGGGIGGGGMLFHKVVAAPEAEPILKDFGIRYEIVDGMCVTDAAELMAKLATGALNAGAKIIHGVTVEDVVYRENPLRIAGVVIQWSAIHLAGLHVDPLMIMSKAVIDATGHDAEVLKIVAEKLPQLGIRIIGARPMYSELGERLVVEKSGRVVPGLYSTGMATAALYGLPRMGPIFSSMLLSGKKVAEAVLRDLGIK